MIIYLERYGSTPHGTFGKAVLGGLSFFTVERPWLNNERSQSCIPAGTYDLVKHTRPNGDEVVALVNEEMGIYHYPDKNADRDLILIHKANTMRGVIGCIAPGESLGFMSGRWAVTHSGDTMDKIMYLLSQNEKNEIIIKWQVNE